MTKKTLIKQPVTTLFLGGLIGTGAALLFAPRSGKESREKIGAAAADMKGRAQCYAMRGRDRITGSAKKTRAYFSERKSLVGASLDAGRKAYRKEKERIGKVH